jgi:hypothetical protein
VSWRRPLYYSLTNSRWDMIERVGWPAGQAGFWLLGALGAGIAAFGHGDQLV